MRMFICRGSERVGGRDGLRWEWVGMKTGGMDMRSEFSRQECGGKGVVLTPNGLAGTIS